MNISEGDKRLTKVKEKLISAIVNLNEDMAQKLLEEWEDILLQLKLESDKEFLKDVEKARCGEDLIDHETLKQRTRRLVNQIKNSCIR